MVERAAMPSHTCQILPGAPDLRRRREDEKRRRDAKAAETPPTHPCPLGCGAELVGGTTHACPGRPIPPHEVAAAAHQAAGLVASLELAGYEIKKKEDPR